MTKLSDQITFFSKHGYLNLGNVVDEMLCEDLLTKIKEKQEISPDIFLLQEVFEKNPVYKGVNPVPGRNMLENFPQELDQVESSEGIVSVLDRVLGDSYGILNRKVICGVPESWIPEWVLSIIRENPVNNLGAYIKPEYRNMTYFYGIDFHQDIIDWPGRDLDFITLYVYLHDVGEKDAPLRLLTDTHKFGVDSFPHKLTLIETNENAWEYKSSVTNEKMNCDFLTITGKTGNVGLWHSCTLHGTQPNQNTMARLSLRYLIARHSDSKDAVIDKMNKNMDSHRFREDMRHDLDEEGSAKLKKNYLYDQYWEKKI